MRLSMESLSNTERIMGEKLTLVNDFHHHHDISNSCSSSSSINEEEEDEETTSCSPTPLQDMSSLLLHLPLKRGLSRNYNGKSQSFTSLSNVKCLEDLAKQENPLNKKLKTCKSYGGFSKKHAASTKKPSDHKRRSHCSSHFNGRRNITSFHNDDNKSNINNDRPPIHPPHMAPNSLIY